MNNRFVGLGLLIVFSSALAWSQVPQRQDSCEQFQSTAEQSECANRQLETAERDLKAMFDATLQPYTESTLKTNKRKSLPKSEEQEQVRWEKAMLKKFGASQQAWMKYRDSACGTLEFMYAGGTISSVTVPLCKADLTRERTKFLQDHFEQE
jgi:uncharacterized protein YecT (DUF1311 family)